MKNVIYTFFFTLLLLFSGCKSDEPQTAFIRFRNIMIDKYEFPYGLNFGDAVYAGSLGYNDETLYIETAPGPYFIYAKRVDGEWIQISEGKFNVLPGLKYTILIYGTVEEFTFQLQLDQ